LDGIALRKFLDHVPHVDARLLADGTPIDFKDFVADFKV
jgi:hypothetical protein